MKKSLYIFVALVTLVLGGSKVDASSESIGDCKYTFKVNGRELTHKFYLMKDGTIQGGETRTEMNVTGLEDVGTSWNFEKDFDKKFYNTAYKNNAVTCPDLRICNNQNTLLDTYVNGARVCDEGTESILARGSFTASGNSTVEAAPIDYYCATVRPVRNKNYSIRIQFFSESGQKKYRISRYDEPSTSATGNIDDYITFDGNTYKIKEDVKNNYFKNGATCVPLFIQVDASEVYTFQTTKPDLTENGSFGDIRAPFDRGIDISQSAETEEDLEGIAACAAIGKNSKMGKQIKKIIKIMRIAIPLLIIIFSIIDLIKVLVSEDDKVYKGTWNNFVKRCIIGVVFFLVPALLRLLFTITEILDIYSIDADSIFCYLI